MSDLRKVLVACIGAGHSDHDAAAHTDTSMPFTGNLMKLWHEAGAVDPRPRGGFRSSKPKPQDGGLDPIVSWTTP